MTQAQVTDAPGPGGSVAGRAYREELARQGRAPDPIPLAAQASAPASETLPAKIEARAAERKKMSGRARVVLPGGFAAFGKMVDMSLTGACVMMEDTLPNRVSCVLEFDIFHNGKRHAFSTSAVSVYGVLASGKGFKVGFQFGACGAAATKCIAELVA
jgi:hypothetical protein